MDIGDAAGIDMTDYWDFFKAAMSNYGSRNSMFQSLYNLAYDNTHGADRYWMSKVPWFSQWRKFQDEAKEAQDRYDNTGKDEAYINRVIGFDGSSFNSATTGVVGRAAKMARSLSEVYSPEVIEDVGSKFNNAYW